MKKIFLAAALSLFAATGAHALSIDISGVAGTNKTTWLFGGSVVADDDGFFDFDDNLNSRGVWLNIGSFTILDDLEVSTVSGNAALSIGSETRGIDLVYLDGDASAGGDDIGIGVTGNSFFNFAANDQISLSGMLMVMGVDVTSLGGAGLPFTGTTNKLGFSDATIPLTLTISEVPLSAVPLPAGLPLLGAGLGALMLLRRRKAA